MSDDLRAALERLLPEASLDYSIHAPEGTERWPYMAHYIAAALATSDGLEAAVADHITCVCKELTGGDGPRPIGNGRVYHFQGCCADSDLALRSTKETK